MFEIDPSLFEGGQTGSLRPLEDRLSRKLQRVNIIGELEIDERLRDTLRAAFRQYIASPRTFNGLLRVYPSCMAVHLVAEGIYGYESGNYWSGTPLNEVGTPVKRKKAGVFFEKFVAQKGLESFPDRTRRYVSLIMLHAIIPNKELNGFFEYALYPALTDPTWTGRAPSELVALWPEEPPASYRLSKVIHTFLLEGKGVAVDFVDRCLRMVEQVHETGLVPSAEAIGLPHRIVSAFTEWWNEVGSELDSGSTSPDPNGVELHKSLEAPTIWLDAHQGLIAAALPQQSFAGEAGGTSEPRVGWRILPKMNVEASASRVPVHPYYTGEHWVTESTDVPLERPARSYDVIFSCPETTQSWGFEGVSSQRPFLLFDGETREMETVAEVMPGKPVWLVYDREAPPEIPGGNLVHAEEPLHEEWEGYAYACWDLSSAQRVSFGALSYAIVKQGQGLKPRLVGGNELPVGGKQKSYFTDLPDLHIPVPPQREVEAEANQWKLEVRRAGGAVQSFSMDDTAYEASLQRQMLIISMASVISKVGQYDVSVRGPLGRSIKRSFTYVGNTIVKRVSPLRFPGEDGSYPDGVVTVRTGPKQSLRSSRDDVRLENIGEHVFKAVFASNATQATVELTHPGDGNPVPLPLAAPGIRWLIRDQSGLSSWSTRPLNRTIDQFLQSSEANLIVDSNPSLYDEKLDGTLALVDGERTVQTLMSKGRVAGQLRFDLLELSDAAARARSALDLRLRGAGGEECSVLRLRPELKVTDLSLTDRSVGEERLLDLNWAVEGSVLKNRTLAIWSEGRPWEDPIYRSIPDDSTGHFRFEVPEHMLPPGPYLAVLDIQDPWAVEEPKRPVEDASNVTRVHVGSVAERINYGRVRDATFELCLERAFLSDRLSETHGHLNNAERLVSADDVPKILRALWWIASTESLLDRLESRKDPIVNWLREKAFAFPASTLKSLQNDRIFSGIAQNRVRHFLTQLGVFQEMKSAEFPDDARSAAWEVWPTIGLSINAERLLRGSKKTQDRADQTVGTRELKSKNETGHGKDRGEMMQRADEMSDDITLAQWKNLTASQELFGGKIQEHSVQLPLPVLRIQKQELNLSLRGFFDDEDSWLAVNYAWLIGYKENRTRLNPFVKVLTGFKRQLLAGLQFLGESHRPEQKVARNYLQRYDPHEEAYLTNVPFLVGATAVLQRAHARDSSLHLPFDNTYQLVRSGGAAYAVAPALFERDICLISLALEQIGLAERS